MPTQIFPLLSMNKSVQDLRQLDRNREESQFSFNNGRDTQPIRWQMQSNHTHSVHVCCSFSVVAVENANLLKPCESCSFETKITINLNLCCAEDHSQNIDVKTLDWWWWWCMVCVYLHNASSCTAPIYLCIFAL